MLLVQTVDKTYINQPIMFLSFLSFSVAIITCSNSNNFTRTIDCLLDPLCFKTLLNAKTLLALQIVVPKNTVLLPFFRIWSNTLCYWIRHTNVYKQCHEPSFLMDFTFLYLALHIFLSFLSKQQKRITFLFILLIIFYMWKFLSLGQERLLCPGHPRYFYCISLYPRPEKFTFNEEVNKPK